MSAFSSLSAFGQTVIPLLLFAEAVLELGLFLYQILRSKQPLRSLPCTVHFVILLTLTLLFSVTQGDPDEGKNAFLTGAPGSCSLRLSSLWRSTLSLRCPGNTAAEKTSCRRFPSRKPPTSCLWASALPIRTAESFSAITVCVACPLRSAVMSCKSPRIWKLHWLGRIHRSPSRMIAIPPPLVTTG